MERESLEGIKQIDISYSRPECMCYRCREADGKTTISGEYYQMSRIFWDQYKIAVYAYGRNLGLVRLCDTCLEEMQIKLGEGTNAVYYKKYNKKS